MYLWRKSSSLVFDYPLQTIEASAQGKEAFPEATLFMPSYFPDSSAGTGILPCWFWDTWKILYSYEPVFKGRGG